MESLTMDNWLQVLKSRNHFVLGVMGLRGTGKTFTSANLIKLFPNERWLFYDVAGAIAHNNYIPGAEVLHVDELISEKYFYKILKTLFKKNNVVIVDMGRITGKTMSVIADYMSNFALRNGLNVVIDEAGKILSQRSFNYSLRTEDLVTIGRNYGTGKIILITQRPANVSKNVYALSDYYMIFQLKHQLDHKQVRDMYGLTVHEYAPLSAKIKMLKVGQFIFTDAYEYSKNPCKLKVINNVGRDRQNNTEAKK